MRVTELALLHMSPRHPRKNAGFKDAVSAGMRQRQCLGPVFKGLTGLAEQKAGLAGVGEVLRDCAAVASRLVELQRLLVIVDRLLKFSFVAIHMANILQRGRFVRKPHIMKNRKGLLVALQGRIEIAEPAVGGPHVIEDHCFESAISRLFGQVDRAFLVFQRLIPIAQLPI